MQKAIPEYFARHNLQIAQLEAYMRNRNGGKRPPKEPPSEPPLTGDELYTAEGLLEPRSWLINVLPDIREETKRDIQENLDSLPVWAKELLGFYLT